MPRRFTVTEKWKDKWFRRLKPNAKLLFLYLCDECDIAGFWEIDWQHAAFCVGLTAKVLETALGELCGKIETDGQHLHITNFLRHQRNWPLNSDNRAHQGILSILEQHKNFKKKPHNKPPARGYGNGKGNGKGKEYTPEFSNFWKLFKGRWDTDTDGGRYEKGSKFRASEEWKKLSPTEQQKATAKASSAHGKFIQDACRWLKDKRFDD